MNFKKILLVFFGVVYFCSVFCQSFTSVIPYEVYAGKMIVKMIINGKEERLIFDTGAGQSSISYGYFEKNNLPIIDSMRLRDVTNTSGMYNMTNIESVISIDQKINFKGLKAVIMPKESPIIDCFNVVGILGSDMLSSTICTIDSKSKTITISDGNTAINESFRFLHNFSKKGHLPIFNIIVNGQELEVLMDTGAGSFMVLNQNDCLKLDSLQALKVLKEGRGKQSIGLSGEIHISKNKKILFSDMRVGPAKFQNVIADTENSPYTLLGVQFLEYAKVIIDYPKNRVFYVPYSKEVIRHKFTETSFGITVDDNKLVVAHLWDNLENLIEEGDIITHIDGVETGSYIFCDVISGIEVLRGYTPKLLTIKTKKGKTVNLEYKVSEVKI